MKYWEGMMCLQEQEDNIARSCGIYKPLEALRGTKTDIKICVVESSMLSSLPKDFCKPFIIDSGHHFLLWSFHQ